MAIAGPGQSQTSGAANKDWLNLRINLKKVLRFAGAFFKYPVADSQFGPLVSFLNASYT